jgi:hypothetical protein
MRTSPIKPRLSCRSFAANVVRLQIHALAYNLGNFLRTLATPEPIKDWSLTSLKEKLIKIGAKVVSHGLSLFRWLKSPSQETSSPRSCGSSPNCDRRQSRQQHEAFGVTRSSKPTGEVRLDCKNFCALNVRLGLGVPRRRPPTGRRQSGGRFGRARSAKHSQTGP